MHTYTLEKLPRDFSIAVSGWEKNSEPEYVWFSLLCRVAMLLCDDYTSTSGQLSQNVSWVVGVISKISDWLPISSTLCNLVLARAVVHYSMFRL